MTKIKNTLEGTNWSITEAEERIGEVECKMVEINEAWWRKSVKRNEKNYSDLWDNVKCPIIQIIGVPEEEAKEKGHEIKLEEIIIENFPKSIRE